MPNSSSGLGYTEGVGVSKIATYRITEDAMTKDIERIAPSAGVLSSMLYRIDLAELGIQPDLEVMCGGRGRIIVKLRAVAAPTDFCSFMLVYAMEDYSIIGASLPVFANFTPVIEAGKNVAVASVFSNDCCAYRANVYLLSLPQSNKVDVFIGAV